jgi:peptidyl-prolyl cis-trans isomerase B (cyclophilin B)
MKTFKLFLLLSFVISFTKLDSQTQFTGKPIYQITTTRGGNPLGSFTVELFPNIAPKHVRNFDSLVNQNFYNGTAFHRCIPGFMIQGGDPNSISGPINTWGFGQPGQPTVPAEFTAAKHVRGILSAARSQNINSATSQFFICVATAAHLNGQYSVYGRVTKGMNYVDTIVLTPKMTAPGYTNMPLQKIEMVINYIGSNDSVPSAPLLVSPTNYKVGIDSAPNLSFNWAHVGGAILYQIQLSRDSTFQSDTVYFNTTSNLNQSKNGFAGNTRYFWRVRANNGGHFSPWSTVWNFHTKGETTGIPQYTAQSGPVQVFPNPGNSLFRLENVSAESIIEVIDSKSNIVHSQKSIAGTNELDLSGKAKGVYIIRVTDKYGSTSNSKLILQ